MDAPQRSIVSQEGLFPFQVGEQQAQKLQPYDAEQHLLNPKINPALYEVVRQVGEADERIDELVGDIIFKIGENCQMLKMEKEKLLHEQRILGLDIEQLKLAHTSELNVAVDSCIAKMKMIAEKVKLVVEMFDEFRMSNPFAPISPEWRSFKVLLADITKIDYKGVSQYPEYLDFRTKKTILSEQKAIVLLEDVLIHTQSEPTIKRLTQKAMGVYETRLAEVALLRAANLALIDKKEIMIDYHKRYLDELNRQEREFRLKKILEIVSSIHGSINWVLPEQISVRPTGKWLNTILGIGPGQIRLITLPQDCHEMLKNIHEHVKSIISTLKDIVGTEEK